MELAGLMGKREREREQSERARDLEEEEEEEEEDEAKRLEGGKEPKVDGEWMVKWVEMGRERRDLARGGESRGYPVGGGGGCSCGCGCGGGFR
jgi:hypothetical protein